MICVNFRYAFVMCNPPFYENEDQIQTSRAMKEFDPPAVNSVFLNPHNSADPRPRKNKVCTGARNEMITDGGEIAFIRQILSESKELGGKVGIYTSLIGRLDDLKRLKSLLLQDTQVWRSGRACLYVVIDIFLDSYNQIYVGSLRFICRVSIRTDDSLGHLMANKK
jgi:23S rRNA A1618 N6-methylase RlmF